MLNHYQALENLKKLQPTTNKLAEEIRLIKDAMTGRGVSPVHAPVVMDRLNEIETKLRILGSNPDNPVPF